MMRREPIDEEVKPADESVDYNRLSPRQLIISGSIESTSFNGSE